jgi:hypothetical protein
MADVNGEPAESTPPPPTLESVLHDDYIAVRNKATTLDEIAKRPPITDETPAPPPEGPPPPEPPADEPEIPDDAAASAAGQTLQKRRDPRKRINQPIAKQRASEGAAQEA